MSNQHSNHQTNQPVEKQENLTKPGETTFQDWENTIGSFLAQFKIVETLVEGPEDGYAEIFCLQNGDTVREEYYKGLIEDEEKTFIAKLINEGFQDSEGSIWSVEMAEPTAYTDPIHDLMLVGPFPGCTPFHNYVKSLLSHPKANRMFQQEVNMLPHYDEESFLSSISPQMRREYHQHQVLLALEELELKIRLYRRGLEVEDVLAFERCFDRQDGYYDSEIFVLKNGEEMEDDIYPSRVRGYLKRYLANLCNEGFTDRWGKRWSVKGEIKNLKQDVPNIDVEITQEFTGETPLHQLVEKMKKLDEAPWCFSHDIDQYVHQTEEQLLSELREGFRDTFLELKEKVLAQQVE